jgi:ADP-ribose pyrophosphatase YjhB (NUDIX family)
MFIRLLFSAYRVYCFIFRPVRTGVRVMMIQNGKVMLVRQTYMPGWFMPGGGLKRGETLEQAARREAKDEIGAELGELKLLGVYTTHRMENGPQYCLHLQGFQDHWPPR